MKVLIRSLVTGTFFKSKDVWTENPLLAHDFEEEDAAIVCARNCGLKDVELHMTSDDGKSLFGTRIDV